MSVANAKAMWEILIFKGVAGILFGIAAVFWPGLTLVTLVYLFSIYILINGLVGIIDGIVTISKGGVWVWKLLVGAAELAVGVYLVRHPRVSFSVLILLIGLTLVVRGVFEVVTAIIDDLHATERVLLVIGGILAVIVGIAILMQPAAGGVAFVWILGLYALLTGPIFIALGIDGKNLIEGSQKSNKR